MQTMSLMSRTFSSRYANKCKYQVYTDGFPSTLRNAPILTLTYVYTLMGIHIFLCGSR